MMRILMLNNEFPPLGGGTGVVNQALLQRFAQVHQLEIDLITSALGQQPEEEKFAERIRLFKVPVNNHNIHHSSNRELLTYAIRAFPLSLKLQRSHAYDFCFAWSAVPAGGVALALRHLTGLPYLVRVCGPDIPGFEKRYQRVYPILTPFIRAIWHGAETVVAKCQGEADMICAVDEDVGSSIIPNGVDHIAFQTSDPIPDSGPFRLLCVGRLIQRKGQHHLIEAVRRLVDEGIDVTLDLVGAGDAKTVYEAQVRTLELEQRVHFAGYVPHEEIPAHYAAAHTFVLPSYNEGMSVATLEAMAAGLPLAVTRTGGTDELVKEGVNGFAFEWGDVDTLVSHLRRLSDDRSLARRMGQASRARAKQFSWASIAEYYIEMLRQMVHRRRPADVVTALRSPRTELGRT